MIQWKSTRPLPGHYWLQMTSLDGSILDALAIFFGGSGDPRLFWYQHFASVQTDNSRCQGAQLATV